MKFWKLFDFSDDRIFVSPCIRVSSIMLGHIYFRIQYCREKCPTSGSYIL